MFEMRTLPQHLLARAAQMPDRVMHRHKHRGIWREYTFADVLGQVRELALGLHAMGLEAGQTLGIIGENEPQAFWAEHAALAVGAKVVSLYPDVTTDEMLYLLEDAEVTVLVAQDQEQVDKALALRDRAPRVRAIVSWDDTGMWSYRHALLEPFAAVQARGRAAHAERPHRFEELVAATKLDDIAVLSYTSGTTGRPKGVILTHRYLVDNAHRLYAAARFPPHAEYLSYIACAWGTEQVFGVTLGLLVPMVVNFSERPEEVLQNIRELAVEVMLFAPRQWESLAAGIQARMLDAGRLRRRIYDWGIRVGHAVHVARLDGKPVPLGARLALPLAEMLVLRPVRDQLGLTRIKLAMCAGSSMAPDVFRLFHALGVPLRNLYGASEIGLLTMHQGERYDLETVGHWLAPHPEAGEPLQWRVSAEGELQVRGGAFFQGYWQRPDKSAERLDDGWYRTGDAVSSTESGELVFLERVEDMRALANGVRFPPQFIETRLRFSPFVKDILTLGDATRDYIGALVNIDMGVVSRWAEERKISFSTFTDLSQRTEVAELVRAEVERVNRLLPEGSRIRRFANFPKELDPDEGELTRTRKLRREFLEQRYAPLIEALYAGEREVRIDIPVTYQDGRRGTLSARVSVHDVGEAPLPRARIEPERLRA